MTDNSKPQKDFGDLRSLFNGTPGPDNPGNGGDTKNKKGTDLKTLFLKIFILSGFLPANIMLLWPLAALVNQPDRLSIEFYAMIIGCGGYVGLLISLIVPLRKMRVLKTGLLLAGLVGFQLFFSDNHKWYELVILDIKPPLDWGFWVFFWPNYVALVFALYFGIGWLIKTFRPVAKRD